MMSRFVPRQNEKEADQKSKCLLLHLAALKVKKRLKQIQQRKRMMNFKNKQPLDIMKHPSVYLLKWYFLFSLVCALFSNCAWYALFQ